jgi:2-C-methyl-D-erythritol 2,4-cyclodiphosphate synthase
MEMTDVIASALGLRPDQVGIKATTNERLGAIGRGEGIAAFAIATLTRSVHRTNDHGTAIPKC